MHLKTLLFTSLLATVATSLPQTTVPPDPIGATYVQANEESKTDNLDTNVGCKDLSGRPQYAHINYGWKCAFYFEYGCVNPIGGNENGLGGTTTKVYQKLDGFASSYKCWGPV